MGAQNYIDIEVSLIRQFQDGDHAAFAALLKRYSSDLLAIAHAGEFYYLGLSSEEARSAAYYGFYEGCYHFDPSAGRLLMTYCQYWVKKAIREYNGRPNSIDPEIEDAIEESDESGNQKPDRSAIRDWQKRLVLSQLDVGQFIGLLPKIYQPLIHDMLNPDQFKPLGLDDILSKYNLDERAFDRIISEVCTILRNIRLRNVSRSVTPAPD